MNIETPILRGGRPLTRSLTRGRSNSFAGTPNASVRSPLAARVPVVPIPVAIVAIPAAVPVIALEPPIAAMEPPVVAPPVQPDPEIEEPLVVPEQVPPPVAPAPAEEEEELNWRELAMQRLRREARRIITECIELVEVYEDMVLNQAILDHIKTEGGRLVLLLASCYDRLDGKRELADASRELERWRRIIKTFIATMLGKFNAPGAATAMPQATQSAQSTPEHRGRRDASPDTMRMIHRDLVFAMTKLNDDRMPDVGMGAEISNSDLRDLHDVTLPQITRAIDECRRFLKTYTSNLGYDRDLVTKAQQMCEEASMWTSDLMFRHRKSKLHLDKNTKHREITFTVFKPGGDVSIYEFISRFETWADDYLSEEAKADQLFHRYIDKNITENYAEIIPLKENYTAMKDWLINKYGSVVPMAHGYVKAILRLTVPNESDRSGTIQYLRSVHRLLVSLSALEISKGVPVPKLQNYLGSNAFLTALVEALTPCIQDEFFKQLVKEGIDDIDNIEGRHHMSSIVQHIKTKYRELELSVKANSKAIPPVISPQLPKSQVGPQQAKKLSKAGATQTQPTANVSNAPQNTTTNNGQPSFLTGGNAVPINNTRQPALQHQTPQNVPQQTKQSWNRWSCPIKLHRGHDINECTEFWSMSPKERRDACRYAGCYTCLERNKVCRGSCTKIEEVPADLICPDCAQNVIPGRSPVCILMCGLNNHRKPTVNELTRALEAWIPNLNFNSLGIAVQVNHTNLGFHSTSFLPPPPRSKTGPPTLSPSNVVYDTTTGEPRPITQNDLVNKTSTEAAFYAMQTVRIKDQDVLMFYDSGSNGHLIEGELAEKLNLDVLASESVPVGALGGKATWSEFGAYSLILGPDIYGECHELELQGISTITNKIPEVNLQEIWDEANEALHGRRQMPIKIGGSRAQILVGIKATQLGPKHLYSLPSGLGIYESVIFDIYQSNICFGGPHAIFTQAYRKIGLSANHVQVMFTEMAQAYMGLPRCFIRVDVEEHGPPLDLARELDVVEELAKAFFVQQKPCLDDQSRLSATKTTSIKDVGLDTDVEDCLFKDGNSDGLLLEEKYGDVDDDWNLYDSLLDHCKHINCMKSAISLAKLKGLQDELDIPEIVDFRCDSCANCPTCKLSARAKTKSLQESFEQQVIEKSVHVDLAGQKVWVDLPFIKEPVEYLTKKHGGPDNFNQASKVYQAQCRKRDDVKDQVRKAHKELVEKGYMSQLTDLSTDLQDVVNNALFRHFYPWRAVYKEDSVTTPVRLVVDPTMTGLNEILAKGVNMLSKIPELLIKFRCYKQTWNTDISKLYNQLHLNESSLPFSLFLYHENLDQKTPPSIWVMSRAWYGVSCTGNQAGVAIEFLADHFKEVHPAAYTVLFNSRYVDDILSGAESDQKLEEQIQQTQDCLKAGGFTLKYVARSGLKPPPKASVDGITVGCLGLSWDTEADTLSLAFNEDFFLKRLKGHKPPPIVNLKDSEALDEALAKDLINRAGILSRVAELYDPCGWWEPIKVQMKLAMQSFNGLDWDSPIPPEFQKEWINLFQIMNKLKEVKLVRSVIPEATKENPEFRIIIVADAAAKACGCAAYVGVKKQDGDYSCNLILAKSKMVHGTIPRNELEGVVLAAESSLTVQRSLLNRVESIRFYTDSRIVVCWVLNQSKRLRMWAYNRVQAIHSMIKHTINGEEVMPLFHINGLDNIADLLTKVRTIRSSDVQKESAWHTGLKWMTLASKSLPCDQFVQITDEIEDAYNQETFQEIDALIALEQKESRHVLNLLQESSSVTHTNSVEAFTVSTVRMTWFTATFKFSELGWRKSWNRLRLVLKACKMFQHGRHKLINASWLSCPECRGDESILQSATDEVIDWAASQQAELTISTKKMVEKFHYRKQVWYSKSRLEKEGAVEIQDLDCSPFFDHQHLKKLLPVVLVKTEIFHAFLAYIHLDEFPHMGVESTLRRIRERFYPMGNARAAIANFRSKCSKCRIMLQKVVALELADFPSARTTVAPPFWSIQLDIAMSFKAKPTITSRKTFSCHALIVVCLLTSATNILVLDGLTTQAVVQAIERHAARYGVPGHLFVDSGTQLEKLQDASFQIRDVQLTMGAQRFQVTVAVPKAHQQQGRVEAKVKIMRKMLLAWAKSCEECNTLIGWETIFAKIASAIDDIPIARGSASAASDLGWEIITPNRLKLGRNNHRQLNGPIILDNCPQNQLERNQLLTSRWYEIFIKRLSLLIPPPAKEYDRQPEVGDVVLFLFTDPNFKKLWVWKLGVIEMSLSRSSYKIRYSGADGVCRYVERAVGQISIIIPVEHLHKNLVKPLM